MATSEYCAIPYLRGKTKSQTAWRNQDGKYFAVAYCMPVHLGKPEDLPGEYFVSYNNIMLAPWWMCKDMSYEQHSIENWEKIYEMDGGWENDDPEEYSIRANQVDYEERCAYYAELRARKAWKKAHPNQRRWSYRV